MDAGRLQDLVIIRSHIRFVRDLDHDVPIIMVEQPVGRIFNRLAHGGFVLDPLVLSAALGRHELERSYWGGWTGVAFANPLMRGVSRLWRVLPIDPARGAGSSLALAAAVLKRDGCLIWFPEGERSIDGELKTFRKGAAILASHLDVAIVPVAFDGLFPLWPRGLPPNWRMLRPGATQVRLEFGEPLRVARGAYDEGTAALRAAVERMFTSMRRRPA